MSSTDTTTNFNNDQGDSTSVIDIAANVAMVRANMDKAQEQAPPATGTPSPVRLVAVSKTKPIELLQEAYDKAGIRIFGENYVQELVEKVQQLPSHVQWHFIGSLQSNKVGLLLSPFLGSATEESTLDRFVLETVSTVKLARKLQWAIQDSTTEQKLKIFVQVNTSGEESKSGVTPSEVVDLCREIVEQCPALHLIGLMTIGAPGDESCLDTLVTCRREVQTALSMSEDKKLELSMGMSGDYELAIAKGSTNVRVGSTIFGARDYSNVNK